MTADPGAGIQVRYSQSSQLASLANSAMDPRDTAPDSWEQEEDAEARDAAGLQSALAALNVNAKPFVPNVNAAVFVPTFFQSSLTEIPVSDGHAISYTHHAPVKSAGCADYLQQKSIVSWSTSVVNKCCFCPLAPVENGGGTEADMMVETWEQKEEPGEGEPGGGGALGGEGGSSEVVQGKEEEEMMEEEEEEELPMLKVIPLPPDAPKKEHVNVVFIGHVDAGKSTIGGQIMYLTGMVEKRTLEKYEREAKEKNRETWYLSWALDTNQEERDKGKTVEVGRAYFETEKKHFTILDAPGHKSFVPNMIGGASQADLAVLVISARKGEFETGFEKGGQTREHAMLAKTAGVKHLIVLVNKMDDPTVNWSLERYEECKEKLVPFLKKVGFNPKKDIYFMPFNLPSVLCRKGLPFIPHLDSLPSFNRITDGPVRLPIVDKYKDMGTVILGKLESGFIAKAQQLVMMPNRHTVEVLSLLSDEVETDEAVPGENLKLRLKGIEEEEILPGFILCNAENLCHSGRTFDAQIVIIEHKSIICPGYNAVLHIHTCIEEVQITALICLVDKKTGEKSKTRPRFVKQDQVCIARLRCAGTICLETFKDFPQMGRFTLRDEGKTIAIGKVLKLVPEKD
uniref:G1 to S phase transition 1 n=1 Tax=Oncorhynchus kisutch TaxID=8019 RepID=A0A8C7FDB1_ONCKI